MDYLVKIFDLNRTSACINVLYLRAIIDAIESGLITFSLFQLSDFEGESPNIKYRRLYNSVLHQKIIK